MLIVRMWKFGLPIVMLVLFGWLTAPEVFAAEACCAITSIAQNGMVTAQDETTGRTFTFQANDRVLSGLRIGQKIYANFETQEVSVDGVQPCCSIIQASVGTGATPAGLGELAAKVRPAYGQPCCNITAMGQNGQVSALDQTTGETF